MASQQDAKRLELKLARRVCKDGLKWLSDLDTKGDADCDALENSLKAYACFLALEDQKRLIKKKRKKA